MNQKKKPLPATKPGLHPRNRHRGRYDFPALVQASPALAAFVQPNAYQDASIDFADPAAVKALNQALLKHFYHIEHWDIPAGYLCPPIPGRADYLHYLADLLAESNGGQVPRGANVRGLDIGVGANCIYPILGHQEYGWRFVGSETDPVALKAARQLVAANEALRGAIDCRPQPDKMALLEGILKPGEVFDFVLCNPPFHRSAEEAAGQNQRKRQGLGRAGVRPALNFGGQPGELWCPGGEEAFVRGLVRDSATEPTRALWYTSLISKQNTLPGIYKELSWANCPTVRTIEMTQGQKVSRFVAWSFLSPAEQAEWGASRWKVAN